MKVDYRVIMESYEAANREFLNDCMEIATEAETLNTTTVNRTNNAPNSTENQVNGKTDQTVDTTKQNDIQPTTKAKTNIIKRIKKMITDLINKIQQAAIKIMNRLKLMFESDKAFFTTLSQRRASVKPLKNFKAITYSYDPDYLDKTIDGISKVSLMCIDQLCNFTSSSSDAKVKQIIESDPITVSNNLLSFFTKNKNQEGGPDVQSFTREMIDTFRGEKSEKMFSQSQIPVLMTVAKGSNELTSKCNELINKCKNSVNKLKLIEARARAQNTTEGITNISRRVTKATSIYNTLLTLSRMYFELKLEEALSARMLLKKFYQF